MDLRALQRHFNDVLSALLTEELESHLKPFFTHPECTLFKLHAELFSVIQTALDASATMDIVPRLQNAVSACSTPILESLDGETGTKGVIPAIAAFRTSLAARAAKEYQTLQEAFVTGTSIPPPSLPPSAPFNSKAPAAPLLGRTRPVYEYVRLTLGVETHGLENWKLFANRGVNGERGIGRSVSIIYEAIRDGRMQGVMASMLGSKGNGHI